MARYQVVDSSNKKINIIEWDGIADLGGQYPNCSITLCDGLPIWVAPPVLVSRRQMMLALNQQGKLTNIQAIVASANISVQIEWAEATQFERTNPVLQAMAQANGWTDADLDNLFRLAGTF